MAAYMIERLTPREKEAARIAASGHSNLEVAQQMHVTRGSVEQYLHRVYEKLGVTDRSQLSYKAESLK
jgi:DNA-binding CsgD family transcriptional regulator